MTQRLQGHRIGFIGLGNMGAPMARHLLGAGADVIVWNRSPQRMQAAVELGMRAAQSPAELAKDVGPGIVCINLTETAVVQSIVFGENGLAKSLDPGAMVIDFGTTGVPATKRFAEVASWVDAPVSGGQVGAEAATLSIMVGGDDAAVARAMPILETVGKRVTHLGPSGSGQVTKLANQLIVAQTIDAVAQALRGLDIFRARRDDDFKITGALVAKIVERRRFARMNIVFAYHVATHIPSMTTLRFRLG
mgnify:CR=1 FL=1